MHGTAYRSIRALGSGGMSDVYEVEHRILGRRFVVKLLKTNLQQHPSLVDRMRVEAQALGALRHIHLVDVTDFGHTESGRPYLVMEPLTGLTLGDLVEQTGPVPARHAVRLLRQLLAALSAAHDVGIVHRDIKLDNVFLHEPEPGKQVIKVLDFGIAKILEGASRGAPAPLVFPTAEGVVVGTPRFVAPEQVANRPLDHRVDIYAAGLVLYSLLAGRGPFDDLTTEADLMRAHLHDVPPPPSKLTSVDVPKALDAIVMQAIAKDPDARYPSARAFSDALAPFAGATPSDVLDTTAFNREDLRSDRPANPAAGAVEHAAAAGRAGTLGQRPPSPTEVLGADPTRTGAPLDERLARGQASERPSPNPRSAAQAGKQIASPLRPLPSGQQPSGQQGGKRDSGITTALVWVGATALITIALAAYLLFLS